MSTWTSIIFWDILKEFEESVVYCNEEEEQLFARKAYDELWRRLLIESSKPNYSFTYNKIFSIFMPQLERRRIRGKTSLGTSLVTCPDKRPRRFHYPLHEMCLDDPVWEIFHNQMRSEEPESDSTVLLMCLECANEERICRVEENDDNNHAEINALSFLENIVPKKIDMYISRSPCIRCLPNIENFIYENQNTIESFRIRFSSLHAHYDSQEMARLRKLDADIGVFNDDDWDHLEKHLTNKAYKLLRQEFKEMSRNQRGGETSEIEEDSTAISVQQSHNDSENDCDDHYESRSESSNDDSGTDFDDNNDSDDDDNNNGSGDDDSNESSDDDNNDGGNDDDDKNDRECENGIKYEDEDSMNKVFAAYYSKRKFENDDCYNRPIYTKRIKKSQSIKYD